MNIRALAIRIGLTTSIGALLVGLPVSAWAGHSACWPHLQGAPSRPDVSCANLTANFLKKLRFASKAEVQKAMGEPGFSGDHGKTLHYISNYDSGGSKGYSGVINFRFQDDKATIMFGDLDRNSDEGDVSYEWNGVTGYYCSDFPHSHHRCNS
jgi:hypothetical protein